MADQAADLNMPEIALDLIGRACDFDVPNYSRSELVLAIGPHHETSACAVCRGAIRSMARHGRCQPKGAKPFGF